MYYNPISKTVYCVECNKFISIYNDVYLPCGCEIHGPIYCLKDNCRVGFTHDLPEIFWQEE